MVRHGLAFRIKRFVRLATLPGTAVRAMRDGTLLRLYPRADVHERGLYIEREYESATLALFDKVLRPGDTMVDVGANLGLMSLHSARLVGETGRVVSVEAHPGHFKRLVGHIELNGLTNLAPVNLAAGEVDEERMIFDVPSVSIGRASLVDPGAIGIAAGTTRVRRLDDILAEQGVEAVRLLKIDVEGFEHQVLLGAPGLIRRRPVICMEVSAELPVEGDGGALAPHRLLMETGIFECFRFAGSKFTPSALVPLGGEEELVGFHDNLIYIAPELRATLPASLFA